MARPLGIPACTLLLAVGSGVAAETDHVKERADTANINYSRDDKQVGGKMASLYVSVGPTWPPSDRMQIQYNGYECTITYCYEFYGWTYCGCDSWSMQPFSGSGTFAAGAFTVSPQGIARLALDSADITGGYSEGTCAGFDLTATPNGEWHWSEDGQITVQTPTEVTRAVSKADEWRITASGAACSMSLTAEDGAGGMVRRDGWNRVVRTKKPQ
jgi:hypothetical protein